MNYADLEIALHRREDEGYSADFRYTPYQGEVDVQPGTGVFLPDLDAVAAARLDGDEVRAGRCLYDQFFSDPVCARVFGEARAAAGAADCGLRVRLRLGDTAGALYNLPWEALAPPDGGPLFATAGLLFSRYIGSSDWRPIRPKADQALQSVVFVANPSNLTEFEVDGSVLAPVDVAAELARARAGLEGFTDLTAPGSATMAALSAALRPACDVLYVVCHGALERAGPLLFLEGAGGLVDKVQGRTFVERVAGQAERPRLVVLASCQSAGTEALPGAPDGLTALGPRLTKAGVPAVIAMRGDLSLETATTFLSVLFTELQRDGVIDRAMAVAREAVLDRPDWFVPVLYMRLKTGRLWYRPGFGDRRFERWPSLVEAIRSRNCVPILGPGLNDALIGTRRELARALADVHGFPMAPDDREDLPQVAQFVAVHQGRGVLERGLLARACGEMQRRTDGLPADLAAAQPHRVDSDEELIELFGALSDAAWRQRAGRSEAEVHSVLARLPFRLYVTTNPDSLMEAALAAAGRAHPFVNLCPWHDGVAAGPDETMGFDALTVERPLVYHLFGQVAQPDSLVLTEDDYFEFLLTFKLNQSRIPSAVLRGLSDKALLFLGFRLDDWNFRVLFRSVMSQEGGRRRNRFAHIAVQIDPEDGRVEEPELARRYLQKYFGEARIDIYWGTVDDFMTELTQHWPQAQPAAGGGA